MVWRRDLNLPKDAGWAAIKKPREAYMPPAAFFHRRYKCDLGFLPRGRRSASCRLRFRRLQVVADNQVFDHSLRALDARVGSRSAVNELLQGVGRVLVFLLGDQSQS